MSDARSIFPNSSWRPRFVPIYAEIPRYRMTFVSFEYSCGSSPRTRKKPTPLVSSLAKFFSLLPNVGSGNDSCDTYSKESLSPISRQISSHPYQKTFCRHPKRGWIVRFPGRFSDQRTFESIAGLLKLLNLGLIESYSVVLQARIILKVCSSPRCWRDYGLWKSSRHATVRSVGFSDGSNRSLLGSRP